MKRSVFLLMLLGFLVNSSVFGNVPVRIISLAPSLSKNIALLNEQKRLVGCTNYCPQTLKDSSHAEVVASAMQVNFEKVLLLHPDLVITTGMTNPKVIATLQKLNIPIKVFPTPRSFDEICSQFEELGTLLGVKDYAIKLIETEKQKLQSILKKVPEGVSPSIFMQIGADPLYGVVPGMFMNDFIRFAGGTNILAQLKQGGVSRETVLLHNPDVIIVVLMGSLGKSEEDNWNKFPTLNAVKNKKVFTVNADNTCSPTPVSFVLALDEIIHLIYD